MKSSSKTRSMFRRLTPGNTVTIAVKNEATGKLEQTTCVVKTANDDAIIVDDNGIERTLYGRGYGTHWILVKE